MNYTEVDILSVKESAVKLFSQDWALLTAGNPDAHNSMTVSWGFLGELWFKHTAVCFIRPQRHTLGFAMDSDKFSLSFYDKEFKPQLEVFGKNSGRDMDKYKESGIKALTHESFVFTDKAKLVLLCKKIAVQDFQPEGFLDKGIEDCYTNKDYHKIFIGEIYKALELKG